MQGEAGEHPDPWLAPLLALRLQIRPGDGEKIMNRSTLEKARAISQKIDYAEQLMTELNNGAILTQEGQYADQGQFLALRTAWADRLITAQAFAPLFRDASLAALEKWRAAKAELAALKDE
jgi:hypothetical protein